MRTLLRNRRALWYANPTGTREAILDENGNETGETRPAFTEPKRILLNVSAAAGEAAANPFGAFADYSRTLAALPGCPLVLGSRVWFGTEPPAKHNYIVSGVADSLNGLLYALKEVTG